MEKFIDFATKHAKYIRAALVAAALALEITPWGAVCLFAAAPEEGGGTIRETYSFFHPIPFGYGNFGPMISAVLTCVLAVLVVVSFFRHNETLYKAMTPVAYIATFAALIPGFILGVGYLSVTGIAIALLLLAAAWLSGYQRDEFKMKKPSLFVKSEEAPADETAEAEEVSETKEVAE